MKYEQMNSPQQSLLFKVIAFFSRLQLRYLVSRLGNLRILSVLFVFSAGVTALGIITIIAYLTKLPLLFPPLGPSAFILFHTPLAQNACPRNVILSHSIAVIAGLFAIWFVGTTGMHVPSEEIAALNWGRVATIALSVGIISIAMVVFNCVHPPAAATALIAAMGYLENFVQVTGLIGAVILLVLEGVFLNRFLGGLPYPLWGFDPAVVKNFSELAGVPESRITFWQKLAVKTFEKR